MFVLPAALSVLLDAIALFVAFRAIGPTLVLVAFIALRLMFLALFAAVFYCERRMSLRLPLLWELINLVVIAVKGASFLVYGAPFKEAWVLLFLCAMSIALELVCVAHLHSSAGTLPRQHVFLKSAVGAMATMNLVKSPSDASGSLTPHGDGDPTEGSERRGDHVGGEGALLGDEESGGEYIGNHRQSSFDERRRFLSDWNTKVDDLRVRWKYKVDELTEKLSTARRNRGWGGAEGSRGGGGGMGGGLLVDGGGAPLLLLARMFAQEQAAIEELEDMWNRDPKWTEFFLPQYTLFLLYASFAHSARLQDLLLGRCESSVQSAHTLYWFLKAFCLQGARVTPVGVKAIEEMLQAVVVRGERPAQEFSMLGWVGDDETSNSKYMELFDAPQEGNGDVKPLGGCFGKSPAFVDELVKISTELVEVAKESRTEELRRRLRQVQAEFLPSRAIYMPLGRKRHRVYRIAVEESFSFSTKDRAPYLVTLEVLDFRQHREWWSSGRGKGAGASVSDPGDAADDRGGGGRGGGKLMKMLTPRAFGQSLRDIADNTITSLKRGVSSKEGRGSDGGGGGEGAGHEDVESHSPLTLTPAGDSLRRRQMVSPPTDEELTSLRRRISGEGGTAGEKGATGVKDGAANAGVTAGATRSSSSSASAVGTTSEDTAADADAVAHPSFPVREIAGGDATDLLLAVDPSAAAAAGTPVARITSEADTGPETDTETKSEQADISVVEGEGNGMLLSGCRESQVVDIEQGRGGMATVTRRDTGAGGGGAGCGDIDAGTVPEVEGLKGGTEEELDGEEDGVRRPVPPSFSSTNLMGMWSRPSKRVSEAGHSALPSPVSPGQLYFSNSPPICSGSINDVSAAAIASLSAEADAPGQVGQLVTSGGLGFEISGGGGIGSGEIGTETETGTGTGAVGGDDLDGDGAGGHGVVDVFSADVRSARGISAVAADARPGPGTGAVAGVGVGAGAESPVARSPGKDSVVGVGEEMDALLLPRHDATPGSGSVYRGGYGSTGVPSLAPATTPPSTPPLISPTKRNGKKRPGGYTELRSSQGGGRGSGGGDGGYEEDDEDDEDDNDEGDSEDGSARPKVIFKERWHQKEARLRSASKLGPAREWRLLPVIVKAGDDLRQEQLASQFFALAHRILKQSPLRARAGLRPYDIVATSHDAGIIEAIPDTVSIDALKKNDPNYINLSDFFRRHFGPATSEGFQRARRYFVESLAANSIVTYLLQVKDRHNGNILLDARGRVIHIDFGFMLANSPGGNFKFESAPFKLTAEFVDLMGGPDSACFKGFRELCVQTFMELRRKMPQLILLLETSSVGNAHLPCFGGRPEAVVGELRERFKPETHDRAAMAHVHGLIDRSMGCWRTSWYDLYQNYAVGIAM